jgi:diguanylate cyclase (GGDEF)-like protein
VFRLSALQVPFVIGHVDIDHFKPFNDQYGYSQGDQVLLHLAGLCRSAAAAGMDFVGHPGGDDFILVMRSTDWNRRITRVVDSFAASCRRFYTSEHIAAGGFRGLDREGSERQFPLMTLSVGIAVVNPDRHSSTADVMRTVGSAKQLAKARVGNAMIVNDGYTDNTLRMPALVAYGSG